MKHYEIVILVHPDQSEQVPDMIKRYRETIESGGGAVHRYEDWGMRRLEYTIQKTHKAHYVLLNIECANEALDENKQNFRYNDAVVRHMIIRRDAAVTEVSPILKSKQKSDAEEAERQAVKATADDTAAASAPEDAAKPPEQAQATEAAEVAGAATAATTATAVADEAKAETAQAAPAQTDEEKG